ncbi:hypothetical protein [Bradyrhizobium sp. McL0616]|uniref:hypothetical protein n=1 Tax=Bradyrhizobium sp. McL0616 TaxID=3415674 RepID=UPI003CED9D61
MPSPVRRHTPTRADGRPVKITFGNMRDAGVRGVLVYCADYRCSHSVALPADAWGDEVRLSDIEPRFVCSACGRRGADVRPDFNWNGAIKGGMGYRNTT